MLKKNWKNDAAIVKTPKFLNFYLYFFKNVFKFRQNADPSQQYVPYKAELKYLGLATRIPGTGYGSFP